MKQFYILFFNHGVKYSRGFQHFYIDGIFTFFILSCSFSFPIVLKLEFGSSAVAVSLISDIAGLREKYTNVQNTLQYEEDYGGIGLGFGNNMTVMEYVDGSEHDVDIVIFQRKMIGAFVSDNGPTRVPHFTGLSASYHSEAFAVMSK